MTENFQMALGQAFKRKFTTMPLFGKMIREHFVERAELEHTCWTSKTVTTTEASKKSENKGCAVLIPLVNIRDQPCMLFTQRALSLKNYSGAVCFPGGKLEADENPEQVTLSRFIIVSL